MDVAVDRPCSDYDDPNSDAYLDLEAAFIDSVIMTQNCFLSN